jgi:AbrB family looped-hinge helix DNA binding protein
MKATVSGKGQVTIPKKLRDLLGIRRGQVLELESRDGLLIGRKVDAEDAVAAVTGILELENFDVDAAINEMRGGPWDPELERSAYQAPLTRKRVPAAPSPA